MAATMDSRIDLRTHGLTVFDVLRNPPVALLYEHGVALDGELITATGALAASSGAKTGRSPRDKRIVDHGRADADIWWGPVNIKLAPDSFAAIKRQAVGFLNAQPRLYVIDGYVGWDVRRRIKIRVICAGRTTRCSCGTCSSGPRPTSWPRSASPTT